VTVVIAVSLVIGLYTLEAKVWGVVLMGSSLASLLLVPWLDRSPVKSIRYRGWMCKTALTTFTVAFLALGYLGTRPPSGVALLIAQIGTVLYFLFFLLMPWYTTLDKVKPVPERVTK
jgi:ubiquinol-cytochrome c reductase cytochrome b subunit